MYMTWIGTYVGAPLPPNIRLIEIDGAKSYIGSEIIAWRDTTYCGYAEEARNNPDFEPEEDVYYYIKTNDKDYHLITLERDLDKSPIGDDMHPIDNLLFILIILLMCAGSGAILYILCSMLF